MSQAGQGPSRHMVFLAERIASQGFPALICMWSIITLAFMCSYIYIWHRVRKDDGNRFSVSSSSMSGGKMWTFKSRILESRAVLSSLSLFFRLSLVDNRIQTQTILDACKSVFWWELFNCDDMSQCHDIIRLHYHLYLCSDTIMTLSWLWTICHSWPPSVLALKRDTFQSLAWSL